MDQKGNQRSPKPVPSWPDNGKYDSEWSDCSFSSSISLSFLNFTSLLAIFRARHDLFAVAYLLTFYICSMLLLLCAHAFNRLPDHSPKKERLKAPILILTTTVKCLVCLWCFRIHLSNRGLVDVGPCWVYQHFKLLLLLHLYPNYW